MARRVFHLILLVSADAEKLRRRHSAIRTAGYYALSTDTADHALTLARKARPSVVLADEDLPPRRALALLQALRGVELLQEVHVIILGMPAPDDHAHITRDPYARVHPNADEDEAGLVNLLRDVLVA
jgi:DNA-binding response OmpR family regulator